MLSEISQREKQFTVQDKAQMKNAKPLTRHKDVYSIVNDRIIEHLEKGVIPWRQPWTEAGLPKNLITGKQYRGINVMLLASLHYPQNTFLTFRQVSELSGTVKQGEKSCPVIYWNWMVKLNKVNNEVEKIPYLRYYNVFNISQCEGIPKDKLPPVIEWKNDPIKSCEEIIDKMPNRPEIRHSEYRAYYDSIADFVNVPDSKSFTDSASYYGTLLHELVHSSGHTNRLNRKELMHNIGFGTKAYSIEELTAEMGACYLKSFAGIPIESLENNSAYIQHWLKKLKNDKKFIVQASTQAQKATDYILNIKSVKSEIELPKQHLKKSDKCILGENQKRELRNNELVDIRSRSIAKPGLNIFNKITER